jgi:ubiquinone/menaquinone biosynthesis C-methylase UbiE
MPTDKDAPSSFTAISAVPDFAEIFERLLVPTHFAPWARDLIGRAGPIEASSRVLDLGCGTGIVSRLLREQLGGAARLSGLDLNAGLLAIAKRVAPELDWHEGDAMSLPFADGSFDLVLSQQMLQFVRDRIVAAREIRRVLVPGGRVLLSTWRPVREQPYIAALTAIAERHFGPSNDARWSFGDDASLRALMTEAGFEDVRVEVVTRTDVAPLALLRLNVMAMGFDMSGLSDADRDREFAAFDAEAAPVVARYARGEGFAAEMSANVLSAVAPAP